MKIAIASGKGGTGKTTLSTNLSAYIAEKRKVVLTDLDVEEPNSGLFLKGEEKGSEDCYRMVPSWDRDRCTLCGKCQKVCSFNSIIKIKDSVMIFPEMCHGCYACSELCPENALPMVKEKMGECRQIKTASFDFIESRLDIGQEQAVPLITQTISLVDERYDEDILKLYDCPPGTSCPVIEAVKDADFIILVTEPTPFGLHDLTLAVDAVRFLDKKFGVVLNRHGIGNNDVLDYCEKENIPVLAKLPNDRKIAELYSKGKLVYSEVESFREQLEQLSEYLEKVEN